VRILFRSIPAGSVSGCVRSIPARGANLDVARFSPAGTQAHSLGFQPQGKVTLGHQSPGGATPKRSQHSPSPPPGLTRRFISLFPRVETLGDSPSPLRGFPQAQHQKAPAGVSGPQFTCWRCVLVWGQAVPGKSSESRYGKPGDCV
jgi:hypothetical protein